MVAYQDSTQTLEVGALKSRGVAFFSKSCPMCATEFFDILAGVSAQVFLGGHVTSMKTMKFRYPGKASAVGSG